MKKVRWNPLKSYLLKQKYGVSFEDVIGGIFIDEIQHPSRGNQKIFIFEYKHYLWSIPFVIEGKGVFLKTIYPSRKFMKSIKEPIMKKIKLTKYEQAIEDSIDEYVPVPRHEFEAMKKMFEARKKNAVLNIRINQGDLNNLKSKAKRLGVKYQTFIAEILHKVALS